MTIFADWLDANGLKHEPHQKEAVDWCLEREKSPTNKGGIIADEMGLGKTIEMLGTVYSNNLPNTLIVLPYSLLGQWTIIITKLMGVQPLIYHSSKRKTLTEVDIMRHPIVLTTYGLISKKKKLTHPEVVNLLHTIKWDRVIYDEAHHLRNGNTCINKGALQVKADITWLMTGTPIQNGEKDLHSLYQLLGFTNIKTNIETLIQSHMLRRTKEKAGIVLPPCNETIVPVEWKYKKEQLLAENIHSRLSFSNMPADVQETQFNSVNEHRFKILAKAKKVCVLPKLLKNTMYRRLILDGVAQKTTKNIDMVRDASKIESVVAAILHKKDNGKPKLIFCYFQAEIDEIARLLKVQGLNVRKFDGRTSKKERNHILNETCEVLIGQIDATNEGLNLQAYNEIYMVSPQWNPAVQDQAIARSHRIGQTEPVEVFHFIMNGFPGKGMVAMNLKAVTLDQHICNVQEIKRKIVKNLLLS
jgi:SNF2 family DNA or RNA helicase